MVEFFAFLCLVVTLVYFGVRKEDIAVTDDFDNLFMLEKVQGPFIDLTQTDVLIKLEALLLIEAVLAVLRNSYMVDF